MYTDIYAVTFRLSLQWFFIIVHIVKLDVCQNDMGIEKYATFLQSTFHIQGQGRKDGKPGGALVLHLTCKLWQVAPLSDTYDDVINIPSWWLIDGVYFLYATLSR